MIFAVFLLLYRIFFVFAIGSKIGYNSFILMEDSSDITTLQNIADTLKEEPLASQRVLAEKAGMSIGLMNAVLKRFAERGWIMLTNVNLKKLSYAITPAGISELTRRSQKFARRTFALANTYNEELCALVEKARGEGKTKLALYGSSYIKFLLMYACQKFDVEFVEKEVDSPVCDDALCVIGELSEGDNVKRLIEKGCISLLDLLKQD